MLPKLLKDFNVVLDGKPLLGVAKKIKLPELEREVEQYRAAGMLGKVGLDLGIKEMKIELTLGEYSEQAMRLWGVFDAGGVNLRFMGALRGDDGNGKVDALEISVRGRFIKLSDSEAESGKASEMQAEMPITYYKRTRNDQVEVEIDLINGVEVVGGVDRTAAVRAAIGQA